MNIKKKIAELWDVDYLELEEETFEPSWLDDAEKVTLLERFIVRMGGLILDGTHSLEGERKAAEINRIQQENKSRVWQMAKSMPVGDLSEEETARRLELIHRYLLHLQG